MDTTLLTALLLGILEGLTEFLPVSSTGHLILFGDLLGFTGPTSKLFDIVIQLGAILAIVVLYWRKLWGLAAGLPKDKGAQRVVATLFIAFLPAMILGAALHGFIKDVLFTPEVVSVALIVGGVILIVADRISKKATIKQIESIPLKTGFKIGLLQCIAMIPGVSRSGATILGGLFCGLDKRTAAEFSFFLAIPTMAGAVAYDLYKNWALLNGDSWQVIAIGFVAAFITGLIVVKGLLSYLTKHGFAAFGYYRILIGVLFIILLASR